jgi:hypothetical protein
MEDMDSALFAIPELVDYRASLDDALRLECLCRDLRIADRIRGVVAARYPGVRVEVSVRAATRDHRPMYLGKRYVAEG